MNFFALIPLFSSIVFFVFAIISFNKNKESILFFILLNSLALINLIFFNIMQSNTVDVIQFWGKLLPVWLLVFPILFHYLICFTDNEEYFISKIGLIAIYIISALLMGFEFNSLCHYFQNLNGDFQRSYEQLSRSNYFYPIRVFSSLIFIFFIILSFWCYKKSTNVIKKKFLKYLLIALTFVFICNLLPLIITSYEMNLFFLQFVFATMPFIYISYMQNKYTLQRRFMSHLFQDFIIKDDELSIVLNNRNEIIYVNNYFLDTLGYKEKDVIGEDIKKFLVFDVEFHLESDDVNRFNISLKSSDGIDIKFIVDVVNFRDSNHNYIYSLLIGHAHGEKDKQKYLNICSYCKNVKISGTRWVKFEEYLADNYNLEFTHGICTDCYKVIVHKYKTDRE